MNKSPWSPKTLLHYLQLGSLCSVYYLVTLKVSIVYVYLFWFRVANFWTNQFQLSALQCLCWFFYSLIHIVFWVQSHSRKARAVNMVHPKLLAAHLKILSCSQVVPLLHVAQICAPRLLKRWTKACPVNWACQRNQIKSTNSYWATKT